MSATAGRKQRTKLQQNSRTLRNCLCGNPQDTLENKIGDEHAPKRRPNKRTQESCLRKLKITN